MLILLPSYSLKWRWKHLLNLKMRASRFANPCLSLLRFDLFPCVFIHSKFFSLFMIQVDSVFFGMPYFIATWDFNDPTSTSFKEAYLPLIDFALSFLFVATVAIVKRKRNESELNLQHSTHARISYNSIRISKANIRILHITMQIIHHVLNYLNVCDVFFVFCCKTCECTLFYLKMAANIINKIVLQDAPPMILTVEISHETQNQWTSRI